MNCGSYLKGGQFQGFVGFLSGWWAEVVANGGRLVGCRDRSNPCLSWFLLLAGDDRATRTNFLQKTFSVAQAKVLQLGM
jgi:hypothetical protein